MMAFVNRLRTTLRLARSTVLPEDEEAATSMLLGAIMANQHKILHQWLDASPFDVNAVYSPSRRSFLITAASVGASECLALLLRKGADINYQDASGNTALMIAARSEHKKCVKKLIEHGADMKGVDISGLTALHWICATNVKGDILLEVLPAVEDINVADLQGQSCLHLASKNGMVKNVQILLEHGIDINKCSHIGETALHFASRYGHTWIAAALVLEGARYLANKMGEYPLECCVQGGHEKTALVLMQHVPHLLGSLLELTAKDLPEANMYRVIEHVADKLDQWQEVCLSLANLATSAGLQLLASSGVVDAEVHKLLGITRMLAKLIARLPTTDFISVIKPLDGLWSSMNGWLDLLRQTFSNANGTDGREVVTMIPRVCGAVEAFYMLCSAICPEQFQSFLSTYHDVLSCLIQRTPELIFSHFFFMLKQENIGVQFTKAIRCQTFEKRRVWFHEQLHCENSTVGTELNGSQQRHFEELLISRESLFNSSCHEVLRRDPQILKADFAVKFLDEEGVGRGLIKEWFNILSQELLNPDYALFTKSADGSTYQPNSHSFINPDHLNYFNFAGQIVGLALYHRELLSIYFTRSFYKHILGIPVNFTDIASIDPEYSKNLQWILDNDINSLGLDLTFSVETDVFGATELIELTSGGSRRAVTDENKAEYAMLVAEMRTTRAIRPQIDSFLHGFHKFIPHHLTRLFNEFELEIALSGLPHIDVADWQSNTLYVGYSEDSQQVLWFWEVVLTLAQEKLVLLLQFVTGTSRVPHGGFAFLPGYDSVIKFTIHSVPYRHQLLPTASTCVNMLRLPEYSTKQELSDRLMVALECGSLGYSMA